MIPRAVRSYDRVRRNTLKVAVHPKAANFYSVILTFTGGI